MSVPKNLAVPMTVPMQIEGSSSISSTMVDDDINDAVVMGGVDLAEEIQRIQENYDVIGAQLRSCKDETFLQADFLHRRMAKICRDKGLKEPLAEVIALMSHATQDRLKTLIEKLSVFTEHRMDVIQVGKKSYKVVQDVRGQLKFLAYVDRLEKCRYEEAERDFLHSVSISRMKEEGPEREKLKAKFKEMMRQEEEQQRYQKANSTALMAIGRPKNRFKLDTHLLSASLPVHMKSRTKRVNMRDLIFLMEQEKQLKKSLLLWKSYLK